VSLQFLSSGLGGAQRARWIGNLSVKAGNSNASEASKIGVAIHTAADHFLRFARPGSLPT
jgi:hypothetical protein